MTPPMPVTRPMRQPIAAVEKALYGKLLWRSIRVSALVTLVTVVLAFPMAYFIAFRVKHNKMVWLILITVPFWTSYLLRVFTWKIILGFNGVINSGLKGLGIIEQPLEFLLEARRDIGSRIQVVATERVIAAERCPLEGVLRCYLRNHDGCIVLHGQVGQPGGCADQQHDRRRLRERRRPA